MANKTGSWLTRAILRLIQNRSSSPKFVPPMTWSRTSLTLNFFLTIKQTSPWIIQALQNFWELTRIMCRHGCYLMVYSSVLQTTRSLISKTIFLITSERQKVHLRTIFNTNQWWWCLTLDHRTSQLGLSLLTFHHQKVQQVPQSDQVLVQMTSPDKCEVTKCIYNQFSIGFQMLNNTQVHF